MLLKYIDDKYEKLLKIFIGVDSGTSQIHVLGVTENDDVILLPEFPYIDGKLA